MRQFSMIVQKLASKWKQYRYRFVPWLVMNLKERSARKVGIGDQDKVVSDQHVTEVLHKVFQTLLEQCKASDTDGMYEEIIKRQRGCPQTAHKNLTLMYDDLGYSITREKSKVHGAGTGVIVSKGSVKQGSVVALYPGTIYQVDDPILLQSIRNPFVFRCIDNILIDGNDKGISKLIFKSCSQRDRHGALFTSDMSWLTANPTNPMAVGQYINNHNKQNPANVAYQEFDVPEDFPFQLRQFIPNVPYAPQDDTPHLRLTRTVVLVALRDIHQGEELFSNYFTVVHNP